MLKKTMREINFWLAMFNFVLAFAFTFINDIHSTLASYFFLVNFIFNLWLASRKVNAIKKKAAPK